MEQRTICFISPKFSDFIGGLETHATEFVSFFLKRRGYKIKAIFTRNSVDDGIPAPKKGYSSELKSLIKPVLKGDFKSDAEKILQNSDPNRDIYYLNSPNWLPATVMIKKQFPKARIIVRSGGNDIMAGWIGSEKDSSKNLEDSKKYLVKLINQYVEKLIVNSDYSLKRTLSIGIRADKIIKIVGGVDCSKFIPDKNKDNVQEDIIEIVTTARLVRFKGIEYSLRAIKEAIERFNLNIKYTIIGDGPEKKSLKKEAYNLGISDRVCFLGAVNLEDIPHLIADKSLFLHLPIYLEKIEKGSSYIHTETMGRSLCEAAACGLPTIASKVGGVPEIVTDGETGLLVKEKDYSAAAEKINLLKKDLELRKRLGKNARNRALELFDFNKIFKQYEEVFKEEDD